MIVHYWRTGNFSASFYVVQRLKYLFIFAIYVLAIAPATNTCSLRMLKRALVPHETINKFTFCVLDTYDSDLLPRKNYNYNNLATNILHAELYYQSLCDDIKRRSASQWDWSNSQDGRGIICRYETIAMKTYSFEPFSTTNFWHNVLINYLKTLDV